MFPRALCDMPQIRTLFYLKPKVQKYYEGYNVVVLLKCENTVLCFSLQCIARGLVVVFESAGAAGMGMKDYVECKETNLLLSCLYGLLATRLY